MADYAQLARWRILNFEIAGHNQSILVQIKCAPNKEKKCQRPRRPATRQDVLQQESFSIGVDLSGTNLRIAAYRERVGVIDTIHLPTRLALGRDQVVEDMCGAIHTLAQRTDGVLVGVGVGTPGPLELPDGILRNPPNLPGWDGFPLRAAIESGLGWSIAMQSDANLAALAEWKVGAGEV